MQYHFTIEQIEFFLLILVRISGFIFTAPFFSLANVPRKVKVGCSVFLAILVYEAVKKETLQYEGVLGYAGMVLVELAFGMLLGFTMNACILILSFSGQIIDMEIGFSMVNVMNPAANMSATITGNLYTYFIMLLLLASDLYRYIMRAIIDAFTFIPVGHAVFRVSIYQVLLVFMKDYFMIGFRIVLPVFSATLVVNVVLGVLAKVAPQMNMFVIGIQLKVFVGLVLLVLAAQFIPVVGDLLYNEMKYVVNQIVKCMSP